MHIVNVNVNVNNLLVLPGLMLRDALIGSPLLDW